MSLASGQAARMRVKPDKIWIISLVAICLLGLTLRLLYLDRFAELPFFNHPVGDSAIYLARASEIAQGNWLPSAPFFYGSVLYPYFLAAILSIQNASIFTVCLLQVLAGGILVATVGLVGRHAYGNSAGLAAAVLTALYGPLAFLEADVLGVVWGMLALSAGILFYLRWSTHDESRRSSVLWLPAAGLCLGLAATERPNLVLMIPLVALWAATRSATKRVHAPVAILVSAAVPVLIVSLVNLAGTGKWVPLTTSVGINLSIGYHSGAHGTFREPWATDDPEFSARETDLQKSSLQMASRQAGRQLTPQEASSFWTHKALDYIMANPSQALALTLRKVLLLLNNTEITNHLNYNFLRSQVPALKWMPLTFAFLLVLGSIGFTYSLATGHYRRVTLFFMLVGLVVIAGVAPFFVADRYRIPLALPLLVGAGYGCTILGRMAREWSTHLKQHAVVFGVAASALVIALLPLVEPAVGRDYWMLAQASQAQGDLDAAIVAYEVGLEKAGDDGAMLNNLALVYRQRGDRDLAIATLRRAIAAESTLALPHKNLGMLLIARGSFDEAFEPLRASLRYNPIDVEARAALGALLAERGDREGAAKEFARAKELAPNDQRLSSLIAHYSIQIE